ncbi:MAG TPA: PASTA domain-containing protein [Solirubrobacterales bacterium]|nr:PASTA domain-containing protein [Solirubrobacterales bacterium]
MKLSHGRATRRGAALLVAASMALLLAALLSPAAQARVEKFETLAPSPAPLTAVAADPTTGLIYAQENNGEAFFVYNPRTNVWSERAPSPLNSGNNGGATYLGGKLYLSYTQNEEIAVYDIATDTWTKIPSPLEGTGDITSGNGVLYLAHEREFVQYDPATGIVTELGEAPVFDTEHCGEEGFEPWGGLQFDGAQIYGHQGDGCPGFGVYGFAANSWTELALAPEVEPVGGGEVEGPVLGSALYPTTNTYLTYGTYEGETLYRYDIEAGTWSTTPLSFGPETEIDDGGMAYISIPGLEGVYIVEGEDGERFGRYTEQNVTGLSPSISANVVGNPSGAQITYSIQVKNSGPERAGEVVLSDSLSGASLFFSGASQGTCNGTTCNLGVLRSGQSADVTIKANAAPGTATSVAKVTSQAINTATDSASVTSSVAAPVKVTPPPPLQCVVSKKLRGLRVKGAKKALRAAHCKPGKVTHRNSPKVKKGRVVSVAKAGKSLPAGTKINLTVSKGPKPKKAAHRKH